MLTVPELRQQVQALEQHIADALHDFSEITGTSIEDVVMTPMARFGCPTSTYHVQLRITL